MAAAHRKRIADRMDSESVWDDCVAKLLGPSNGTSDRNKRTSQALHMAAAALRAAGRDDMALSLAAQGNALHER